MLVKPWKDVLIIASFLATIVVSKFFLMGFKSPSAETYFINPSPLMQYFTFGYRDLVADMLWLRVIQDLDHCERPLAQGESCHNSWVYKMTDQITTLSPHFRMVYATIPLMLSLTVNDTEGAIKLHEKGLQYFPNDWPILYRGGYLYLYERDDKLKAAEYFLRAQKNGAPKWLAALATRLYTQVGRVEMAEKLVEEYKSAGFDSEVLKRMKERLDEANSRLKD